MYGAGGSGAESGVGEVDFFLDVEEEEDEEDEEEEEDDEEDEEAEDPDDEEVKLSNQRLGTRRNLLLIVTFAFFSTYVAVVSTYY